MSPPAGVVDGLLAGRYRLVARIGAGGTGELWRALDQRLDRAVAVRVLRPELAADRDVRARFEAQARHARALRHPGIAAVLEVAEGDDGAWVVRELVDGQPLSAVLSEQVSLPVDRTLDVMGQAAAALQAAHGAGVLHLHVTPDNLLLRPDGRLRVTDFGTAHAAGAAAPHRPGQVAGTAAYLSPEQASGRPLGAASDLYSLGAVAHECLSGVRSFERDDPVDVLLASLRTPPPALPTDVPEPVGALVRRMLAEDPADRPTAAQVAQEAGRLRREVPCSWTSAEVPTSSGATTAPPAPPAPSGLAGRLGQRRAVRATALALGLLAVALGVRDATQDDPAIDVHDRPPARSAPPALVPAQDAPERGGGG